MLRSFEELKKLKKNKILPKKKLPKNMPKTSVSQLSSCFDLTLLMFFSHFLPNKL